MENVTTADLDQLENLVDRFGLSKVVELVADLARIKAVHIRENWQDEGLARTWIKDAEKIENVYPKIKN